MLFFGGVVTLEYKPSPNHELETLLLSIRLPVHSKTCAQKLLEDGERGIARLLWNKRGGANLDISEQKNKSGKLEKKQQKKTWRKENKNYICLKTENQIGHILLSEFPCCRQGLVHSAVPRSRSWIWVWIKILGSASHIFLDNFWCLLSS